MQAQKFPHSDWIIVEDVQIQTLKAKEKRGVFDQRTSAAQCMIVADCESENAMRGGGGRGANGLAATREDIVTQGAKQQNLRGIVRQRFGIAKPGDCFNPAQGLLGERRCRGILFRDEKRTDPKAYEEQLKSEYIQGVEEERPAVVSVNAQIASIAVNEFLARLHPYRYDPNSDFAITRVSLLQGQTYHESEEGLGQYWLRHVGRGDVSPLLDMAEIGN